MAKKIQKKWFSVRYGLFAVERRTLGGILHPIGASLLAVARRKTGK